MKSVALRTVLAVAFVAIPAAQAGAYPTKPVRFIVPFAPGGGNDIIARVIGARLTAAWGQQVVVDNRPGAGGNIAAETTARAVPDGHTIFQFNVANAIAASLYRKLAYDPVKDFVPITQVFVAANILVVHPDVPVSSIPELVALAKAEPGKLTYAHTGIGTSQHLAGELFKHMAHVDIRPVAYRGTTAVLPDLLAGRLSMSFSNISNVLPLVREGKLKGFAVSSARRSGAAPDLPTMIEMGYPGFEAVPWFGLMAPAGTPTAVTDRIYSETMKVLTLPEVRKQFADLGIDVIGGTSAEFAAVIATETVQWAKLIKAMGIGVIE